MGHDATSDVGGRREETHEDANKIQIRMID